MDHEGLQANYIAGTSYLGISTNMYPRPGGYRGEFIAWDVANAKKVWSIKEPLLPVYSGVLATGGDVVFYSTMDGWFRAMHSHSGRWITGEVIGMRTWVVLTLIIVMMMAASGCSQPASTSAANVAPPALGIPVGPIPGPNKNMPLPHNPYEGNAVALQEGRRLFLWFNCAGCHGGHGGGGWGRPSAIMLSTTVTIPRICSLPFPKDAARACRPGAPRFLKTRFGSWWHISSPCARRRNQIHHHWSRPSLKRAP